MLKSAIKSLGRDTIIYGIAGALQRITPLFIVPILTHSLSKEEYGIYDTAMASAIMLSGFAIIGQDNAVARFLCDHKDKASRYAVVTSGFVIQLTAVVLFIGMILGTGDLIGSFLFSANAHLKSTWAFALWIVPGFSFFLFSQNLLKWTLRGKSYLALSCTFSFVSIGLSALFILMLKLGIQGAILAQISAYSALSLLGLLSIRRYLNFKKMTELRRTLLEMLRYGLPFVVVMVVSNALPVIDRYFVVRFDTASNLGIYALGLKVAMLMMLIVGTFQIAFGPIALSMWDEKHAPDTFRSLLRIVSLILGFFALLLASNGEILVNVLGGTDYEGAVLLLPFLCTAMVVSSLLSFTMIGILKSKRSRYNLMVVVVGLFVALMSNALLVPFMGIIGAAISTILVQLAMNIYAHLISKRYFESLIEFKDMLRVFGVLAIGMGILYVGFLNKYSGLYGGLMFCIPFIFLIIEWFWVLGVEERREIRSFFYLLLSRENV